MMNSTLKSAEAMDAERGIKLSCRNVSKIYGDAPVPAGLLEGTETESVYDRLRSQGLIGAVTNANLDIHDGEIFVIMGLSGSGKSTLVRCMSRLIEPTFGEILYKGNNLLNTPKREMVSIRRHEMGMVFQAFALFPHLTVQRNVTFPLEIQRIDRKIRERRAKEVIDLVGLQGREAYFPRELSGGQQQRVGLARSLIADPELWFLDEPFSALDPLIRHDMQSEFLRLQAQLRKTIVFITHDFDEAVRVADRIAIMKDGNIIQIGTAEELVLNPASDYVSKFTRNINKAQVVTARSIMERLDEVSVSDGLPRVPADARIVDIADVALSDSGRSLVVDENEVPVGCITRSAVVKVFTSTAGYR